MPHCGSIKENKDMTINHIKLMNNALEQNLSDDHNGFTNELWFNSALASMAEVERLVREECAVEQKQLRDACLLARETFARYADEQEVKGTTKADQKAKHYRWMAEHMRDAMNGFTSPTLADTTPQASNADQNALKVK
jgi:hypothetical protein